MADGGTALIEHHLVDPEGDVIELIRLRPFADAVVAEATAFKTGALRLDLLDGTVVSAATLRLFPFASEPLIAELWSSTNELGPAQ